MASDDPTLGLLVSAQVRAMRIVEDAMGESYSGLQAAARRHRRLLSPRLAKQMARLDTATALARHISESRVQHFLDELRRR